MHFDFFKNLFPQCDLQIEEENGIETIRIKNKLFEDYILVSYYPDDYYKYLFRFATQHLETSSIEQLTEYVTAFVNTEKAAIEFYEDGRAWFGGDIDTALLENLTYDSLRKCYFGHQHLKEYSFTVRAWDERFCFNAHFITDENGKVTIVKEPPHNI